MSRKRPWTFSWTISLLAAVHRWPEVQNAPHNAPSTARSSLASSMTIMGFFPPISHEISFSRPAHSFASFSPTALDPVKGAPAVPGWLARYSPVASPVPWTRFSTPMSYWIFQAVPKRYRLLDALAELDEILAVFPAMR